MARRAFMLNQPRSKKAWMRRNQKDDIKPDENKTVIVRQIHSTITEKPKVRRTLYSLGLGRIGKERKHKLTPPIAGMINKVKFLVEVKEV